MVHLKLTISVKLKQHAKCRSCKTPHEFLWKSQVHCTTVVDFSFSRTATHKYLIGHLTIGAVCARTLYFLWTHATALIRHKLDELTIYDAVFSRTRLLREQTAFRIQANTYPAEFVDHISRPAVGPDYRTPRCFGAIRPSPGNNNKQSGGRR